MKLTKSICVIYNNLTKTEVYIDMDSHTREHIRQEINKIFHARHIDLTFVKAGDYWDIVDNDDIITIEKLAERMGSK